ncbi:MAG: ATP-grasp fold amidoligase family protein [Termitinemataceae bacterium]|nr:MAG: ATP-grasp fold amidoligase family protein [Termitinemataceae bacterium]
MLHPVRTLATIVCKLDNTILYRRIPDAFYLKSLFTLMGQKLNLKQPQYWTHKIQWIKLFDRNPLYTKCADKYAVREYISQTIGDTYLIPLLGVFKTFDEIDFSMLPEQFVLKCNHDSGSVIICKDKNSFDKEQARLKLQKALSINYCNDYPHREWVYKNIPPCIVAEKYVSPSSGEELRDYKFFCFNGEPKCLYVSEIGMHEPKVTFYDLDWNEMPVSTGYEKLDHTAEKPNCFDEMLFVCRNVSKKMCFVRVDLYEVDGKIYFGELTFYPHAGYYPFSPEWNKIFGDWLKLPTDKKVVNVGKKNST